MSKTLPFLLPKAGIDMLSNETSLVKGAVREATNVLIGREGRVRRRNGQTLRIPGMNYHSLWGAAQRGTMFVAQGTQLYTMSDDLGLSPLAQLSSPDRVAYTEYNGNVYWTNRGGSGWLPSDSKTAQRLGVPTPESAPTLRAAPAGGLTAGEYAVVITYVNERGEEGGATEVMKVRIPGGGVMLENLPTLAGYSLRIYMTDPDGTEMHMAEEIPAVFQQYTVTSPARGGVCSTQYLTPLPPGEHIAWLSGRLYTACDDVLRFSEPLRPHLHSLAHGFIKFSGRISFIEPVLDGMYVGDSRGVWFLSGVDAVKFEMALISPHRALKHSSIKVGPGHFDPDTVNSKNPVAVWLSTAGYVVGMDGGNTVEVQADRIRIVANISGGSTFVLRHGVRHIITPVPAQSNTIYGHADDTDIS